MTCGTEIDDTEVRVPSPLQSDIVALISLVGDLEWTLMLALPKATAESLAARFAGFAIPFDSPDMGDAIGELTNILGGEVKARLDQAGVRADISLPSVMRGQNISILGQRNSDIYESHLESPLGHICIGVVSEKRRHMACAS